MEKKISSPYFEIIFKISSKFNITQQQLLYPNPAYQICNLIKNKNIDGSTNKLDYKIVRMGRYFKNNIKNSRNALQIIVTACVCISEK